MQPLQRSPPRCYLKIGWLTTCTGEKQFWLTQFSWALRPLSPGCTWFNGIKACKTHSRSSPEQTTHSSKLSAPCMHFKIYLHCLKHISVIAYFIEEIQQRHFRILSFRIHIYSVSERWSQIMSRSWNISASLLLYIFEKSPQIYVFSTE